MREREGKEETQDLSHTLVEYNHCKQNVERKWRWDRMYLWLAPFVGWFLGVDLTVLYQILLAICHGIIDK